MDAYLSKQLFIALIAYLGQLLVGFALGWTAPMIPKLQDPDLTPLSHAINEHQASWVASVLFIGTITGPYVSTYLSNLKGRKPCFILGGILTVLSFMILALARNLAMIFAGRILKGLGVGIIFVTNLVYLGEIASTNIRGMLLTGTGIFSTVGTLVVYSVGPYTPYPVASYIGVCLSMFYLVGLYFIPESPMFYILRKNNEQAIRSLVVLGRPNDVNTLEATKADEEKDKGQFRDLFFIKSNRKAFIITFQLNILQQLSGIVVVVFFATTIFDLANSSVEPEIATIIIGVVQIVSSVISPIFVDWNGRKTLLLVSTGLCCMSLAVLGLYFFLDEYHQHVVSNVQWIPLVSLIAFFFSYDFGFGIIPNTYIGEMFQSNVRSIGSAITVTSGWIFGFVVSSVFGYMITGIGGHFTFWLFSGFCGIAFLFTLFYVPETKGKSFSEIQEILSK